MFPSCTKRMKSIMPKPKGYTCGLPSNWIVFGIGTLSVIESITFMVIFGMIIEEVEKIKNPPDSEMWWFTNFHIEKITSYGAIAVYTIRLIFAGMLIVGQYLRIAAFLATYFILALFGIVFNILIGIEAYEHTRTKPAGTAILLLAIVHLIFAIIVLKICKDMRVEQLAMRGRSNAHIIQNPSPETPPVQAIIHQRQLQTMPVIHEGPPPSYTPVYSNQRVQPVNENDYDLNPETSSYRLPQVMIDKYRAPPPPRPIKPFEEDEDVPTIYYAPQHSPPRYSEIDIESKPGRSGPQTKSKKDEYFGFSNV